MPKPSKHQKIRCTHFSWRLVCRHGVWYADGRSNTPNAGRHSLGTGDKQEAIGLLPQLDQQRAEDLGLAPKTSRPSTAGRPLLLDDGRQLYEKHNSRPRVAGGVRKSTIKRYRAVFDKFEPFAKARGVTVWNGVTAELLIDYAAHLAKLNYAHKTQGNELVTLKQAISWLIKTGHLAGTTPPELTIRRAECQPAYCYRPVEVAAMIKHCQTHPKLHWMEGIITALACTGVRISELAALCWADIDLENCRLLLTDETGRQANAEQRRMLKSGRSRTFPIHPDLVKALRRLPRRGRYVFYGPRSGRLKPDTVRNVLVREVIEPLTAKFPAADGERGIKHGRVHSFRHYFCSTCANNGVPERMVMDWLGHADSAMIRHYYHLHDEEAQRRMKSVDFLGGAGRRSVGQGEGEPKKEDVEPPPAERRVDADGRD